MNIKQALKLSVIPVVTASLCCFSSVILVLLGLSTVSFASSLSDTLYGEYKWIFRAVGLILLLLALAYYFYKEKGICTLDQAKRKRNEIINTILITLIVAVLGYVFFLYVVVHYVGVFMNLWA